jgi:hypothetical protein
VVVSAGVPVGIVLDGDGVDLSDHAGGEETYYPARIRFLASSMTPDTQQQEERLLQTAGKTLSKSSWTISCGANESKEG